MLVFLFKVSSLDYKSKFKSGSWSPKSTPKSGQFGPKQAMSENWSQRRGSRNGHWVNPYRSLILKCLVQETFCSWQLQARLSFSAPKPTAWAATCRASQWLSKRTCGWDHSDYIHVLYSLWSQPSWRPMNQCGLGGFPAGPFPFMSTITT